MAFTVKYRCEWIDDLGVGWRYDVEEDNYTGDIIDLVGTDEPLRIEFLTYSDDLLRDPIKGSTATLNIECTENFQYIDLYDEADMVRRVKIYYGSTPTLYWQGWLSSEYSEPYDAPPYAVSITALDGLGLLKYIDFKDGASYYSGRETEREIILNILGKIGHTEFDEFINLYEDRINSEVGDSPVDQIKVEQDLFRDEDCYTVLVEILKHYNAIIRQEAGKFIIYRPIELIGDTVYGRTITASTITATSLSPDQYLYRDGYNTSELRDFNGGMLMMRAPTANVKGIQNYNQVDSWVRNHSFDINRHESGNFEGWNITSPLGLVFGKISSVPGFEGDRYGVGITYGSGGSPDYTRHIDQVFGHYAEASTNVFEFSFEYAVQNLSDSLIGIKIYLRIRDEAGTVWMKKKVYSETELDEASSASVIETELIEVMPGITDWTKWSRVKVGLTKPGPYHIYFYPSNNIDVTIGIKNVVFRATSDKVAGYTYPVTAKFLWWKFTGATRQYRIKDVEEVVQRKYTKVNGVNGEVYDVDYDLGDVSDVDIDNVMDQFDGALSVEVSDTFKTAAKRFATEQGSNYVAGGVIVSSIGDKIRFTSSTPGQNFTGNTSIATVTGLTGSVATVQANVVGRNLVMKATLSGSMGSGSLSVNTPNPISGTLTYGGTLESTASAFVSANSSAFYAAGYNLTSSGNVIYIELLSGTEMDVSYEQEDANLNAVIETHTTYAVAQARIDEITLSGNYGSANITCDGVTRLCTYSATPAESYTESWSTRGGSESSNLLELLVDEIAALKSKGSQFIQVNIMENAPDTFLKLVSNVQDPINVSGVDNRVFVPTRGSYDVARRTWTIDMIEIGEKTAPAV